MLVKTDPWGSFKVMGRGDYPVAIAGLCAFFYFDRPVAAIARELADGLERYVDYVGLETLRSYIGSSGYWKPMARRRLNADLKHLRNFPPDYEGAHINYDAGEGGVPGPFGVVVAALELDFWKTRDNLIRFDFPPDWVGAHPPEEFMSFIVGLLDAMAVESANVGLAFKRTEGSKGSAIRGVNRLLPRYLGLDPCYSNVAYDLHGRTFTAHWLNFVNDGLAKVLGGHDALASALPGCEVRKLSRGTLIRGAKYPPIGDINRGAPDLGCLPDVARALGLTRVDIEAFGEPDFDARAWLARLDELPSRPWDNSNAR
jgi:hypothetical protein